MKIISMIVAGALSIGFLIIGCGEDTGPTGPDGDIARPEETHVNIETMQYELLSETRIQIMSQKDSCDDSILVQFSDTSISRYFFSGDTLVIIDSVGLNEPDTSSFLRLSGGNGIQGKFSLINGVVDDTSGSMIRSDGAILIIGDNVLEVWIPNSALITAVMFVTQAIILNSTIQVDVEVDTAGGSDQLQLVGTKTNEIVTLKVTADDKLQWSSTNPDHQTINKGLPIEIGSCPEDDFAIFPPWIVEFFNENTGL